MPKKLQQNRLLPEKLKVISPNAAGIDIPATEMLVCVPDNRDADCNRCLGCFPQDLEGIAKWLAEAHNESVA